MYGTDFVNAKRVINSKFKNHKPNPDNLTLAERILLNRRRDQQQRRDSPGGSVDISDLTNHNDERKTPTPEPTLAETARRSPLKKQDSRRTLTSEPQPGPSNARKSETPPLPPIKTASPKQDTRANSVNSRKSNIADNRKQTPVLPPIIGKESRNSNKDYGAEDVQPPKDTRQFDPNIGVGVDSEEPVSPQPETPKPDRPEPATAVNKVTEARKEEVDETKAKVPTPQPKKAEVKKPETPKPAEKAPTPSKTPEQTVIVPVVAAAATRNTRSRSRSNSRSRKKSRSRSRSRKRSRSPKKRSRSRKKSRHRSSSSSRSSSRRRHRRSRSRKRYRSLSYSSSPRRRRRYSSSSDSRRRHSRGRSRSRRRSFDYDFERAKSIIRSLSRVGGEFPRQRPYDQPLPNIAYPIYPGNPAFPAYGGNPMYWPTAPRPESPKRKKQIIIVKDGQISTGKRRNNSSSESDVSVIVQNGKNKGKKGKVRRISLSESDSESSRSKSRNRKKKGKKVNFVTKHNKKEAGDSEDSESESKNKVDKKKRVKKQKEISDKDTSDEDPDTKENIPKAIPINNKKPIVKQPREVHAAAPLQAKTVNKTPVSRNPPLPKNKKKNNTQGKKGPSEEERELQEAMEKLDQKADYELEQLKGNNSRKHPPSVDTAMQKKIFGKEFQESINAFLES